MKKGLWILGVFALGMLKTTSAHAELFSFPQGSPSLSIPALNFCDPANGVFTVASDEGKNEIGGQAIFGKKSFQFMITCSSNPSLLKINLPAELFVSTGGELNLFGADEGIGRSVDYYNVQAWKTEVFDAEGVISPINLTHLKLTVIQANLESVMLKVEMPSQSSYGRQLDIHIKTRPVTYQAVNTLPQPVYTVRPLDPVARSTPVTPTEPSEPSAPLATADSPVAPEAIAIPQQAPVGGVTADAPKVNPAAEETVSNAMAGGGCSLSGVTGMAIGDAVYALLGLVATLPLLGRRKK